MSSDKSSVQRKDGVVYTPDWVVELMVETLFTHRPFDEKSVVLDPACGDGAFLRGVARHLIKRSEQLGLSPSQTSEILSNSLSGYDIDPLALEVCKSSLDLITAEASLPKVNWQLGCANSLFDTDGPLGSVGLYTHIIANPPYIRIQDLDVDERRLLQKQYAFCQRGSTDIFLAFFELSLNILGPDGVLAFINSRSFFDSAAAADFRRSVSDNLLIREIIDFGDDQVFPDVTTYTAVTVLSGRLGATHKSVKVRRHSAATHTDSWSCMVPAETFGAERWHIMPYEDQLFIKDVESRGPKLGEVAAIRVGLATLRDKIYVGKLLDDSWENSSSKICKIMSGTGESFEIEKSALRRIVKVSTVKADDEDQRLVIIFPYNSASSSPLPWTEEDQTSHPLAMSYLSSHRNVLAERGHDVRSWFEYGSTQGLATLFGEKILVSSMTEHGEVYFWSKPEFTLYSGYAIFFAGDVGALHKRLCQEDFKRYVKLCGRTLRGGWFSMTKSSLFNFSLRREEWIALGIPEEKLTATIFDH